MPNPKWPWRPPTRLIRAPRGPTDHGESDLSSAASPRLPAPVCAGLYVDVENLPNTTHAQHVIETVIGDWPDTRPPVARLSLYVPAQKADLWRFWARNKFAGREHTEVRSVPRQGTLAAASGTRRHTRPPDLAEDLRDRQWRQGCALRLTRLRGPYFLAARTTSHSHSSTAASVPSFPAGETSCVRNARPHHGAVDHRQRPNPEPSHP